VCQAAEFIRGLPDLGAELREETPGLVHVTFSEFGRQAQLDGQGGEPLLGAVMKVALDPAPLGTGRGHDPGPRGMEFRGLAAQLHHRGVKRGTELRVMGREFGAAGPR
jgi:hypothetical protein